MISRVVDFIKSLRVEAQLVAGTCKASGHRIVLLSCVKPKTDIYLDELLFSEPPQRTPVGSTWLWNLAKKAPQLNPRPSLVLLEMGLTNRKLRFYGPDYLRICMWVRGHVNLPLGTAITRKKDYKEQLRKIRKHGFGVEIASSTEQVRDFYQNMYVPQVQLSHMDSAVVMSEQALLQAYQKSELLLITLHGKAVAGEFISYENPVPRLHAVGVRNRDPELLRMGAVSACYHFGLQHLQEKGYSRVDLGASRGFLHDGVLDYKRKWGQVLDEPVHGYLLMKILNVEPETVSFLENFPVLCHLDGSLVSLAFAGAAADMKEQLSDKQLQQLNVPGTDSLRLCQVEEGVQFSDTTLDNITSTTPADPQPEA